MFELPLAGLRIPDMARVLAGPYATAFPADFGAEVIWREPPAGDEYRHIGPFRDGEGRLFLLTNAARNPSPSICACPKDKSSHRTSPPSAFRPPTSPARKPPMTSQRPPVSDPRHMHSTRDRALADMPGRHARDARIMHFYEGSSEIQRNIIAAHLLA